MSNNNINNSDNFEDKLNDIVLECKDEIKYKDPEIMLNSDGTRKFAYVTLVMLGDKYIPAALVLAYSLRKLNTMADLVVLITPDVTEEAEHLLGKIFDKVIKINYITVENWRTKKQVHRKYLELVFTKFHLFNLTEYEKVLLIDADALVLKYPDHLFTLNAPAGCFLEDKDLFISYDSTGNYILPPENKIQWYEKYCDCCSHGKKIPKEFTDKVLKDYRNSGIGGGLILLQPKKGELESILKDVTHGKMKYLLENKFVWPEQQYLCARYSGQWTSINPRFFGLQGYPHWKVLYGLQYGGDKPFSLDSKFDISLRVEYPDFILWHKFYGEMLKDTYKDYDFKDNKVLKEANEMYKYFVNPLKRFNPHQENQKNKLKNYLSKIFKTPQNKISDNLLDFYHTQPNRQYRPINLNAMFEDIEEYDYLKPIELLNNKLNNEYYKKLLGYQISNSKTRLDLYDNIDPLDKDEIMLQYVKCRKSIYTFTFWPPTIPHIENLIKYLEKIGNIYYIKRLTLDYKSCINYMCMLYNEYTNSELLERMKNKASWMHLKEHDLNDICVVFFDNVNNLPISGQGSKFKNDLRQYGMDLIKESKIKLDFELYKNDIVHINDHFFETIQYSQIVLNSNSLNMLKYINHDNFYSNFFDESNLKFQTLRKYLYNNIDLEYINRICLIGGFVLYAIGVRNINDIDGIMINPPNENLDNDTEQIIELINTACTNRKTKFEFCDIGIENSKYWRESWTEKNKKVLEYFNIKDFSELTINPKYHAYFNGIKIFLFEHELLRKMIRLDYPTYVERNKSIDIYMIQSAKDYADIITLYFTERLLISHYFYLDSNNKLKVNQKFKITNKEFTEEELDKFSKIIHDFVNKNYPKLSNLITLGAIKKLF